MLPGSLAHTPEMPGEIILPGERLPRNSKTVFSRELWLCLQTLTLNSGELHQALGS